MTIYVDNLQRSVKHANDNVLYKQIEEQNNVSLVQSIIIDELLDQVAMGNITGNKVTFSLRLKTKEPLATYKYGKWTISETAWVQSLNTFMDDMNPDPGIRISSINVEQTSVKDNYYQCSCCFWCPCFFFPLCFYDMYHGRKYRFEANIGIKTRSP